MPVLPDFGSIRFSGTLRPSQKAASSVIIPQLESGKKRLHIVAPPGSGKTVLGLYVWADLVRKPALVLSPNSAIQAQWAARTSLFDLDGKDEFISTDPKKPGLLTSLTYQSVTMVTNIYMQQVVSLAQVIAFFTRRHCQYVFFLGCFHHDVIL